MNRKLKEKIKPYILLMPAILIITGIFITGLILGLSQSLGYFPLLGLKDFGIENYIKIFGDKDFLESIVFSLKTSFISSMISVIIGVMLAYIMSRSKIGLALEKSIYKLPIVVPHLLAALLAYNVLSQSGILARVMFAMGFISNQEQFPILVFDRGGIGIIIAYIWKGVPFIAMVTYGVLKGISEKHVDVAKNLGATDRQVFTNIFLPMAFPAISSSFIIIFAFSFGAFEIPYLLGPSYPKAIPVKAYIEYINPDWSNRPYAMAINMVLTVISIVLIGIYQNIVDKVTKYKK